MKHKLLIALLGLGTIAGYGASCASLHGHHRQHTDRFEDRVADVCAAAAHRVYDQRSPSAQTPAIVVPWAYPAPAIPPPVTPAPNTTPPAP